jgi:hypothetical protein
LGYVVALVAVGLIGLPIGEFATGGTSLGIFDIANVVIGVVGLVVAVTMIRK